MTDDSQPAWRAVAVAIGVAIALYGCAHRGNGEPFRSATMPDPGGCYALVYEQSEFMGAREFINGPVRYSKLEDLPFRANWRRRIRSVQVGPTAAVTIWAGEAMQEASQAFPANSKHPVLSEPLSGRVQSLEIRCTP